ncbi:MAG TPA: c-type cytochrome [Longimicrobiales bacterium]|nr:c-type cytochrome [Longimicrobiales bacterium]
MGARTAAALIALAALPAAALSQDAEHPGKATYERWCAGCHGVDGAGEGAAAGHMLPRPRDFTQALYQVRTTTSGALPTDADILRVIDEGMPGTSMPGWKDQLSRRERQALVSYLKTFSRFFENEEAPPPLELGSPPRIDDDALARGREVYDQVECWKCHGRSGRGNGTSAPTQEDDNGHPIRPANLTESWRFNGGGSLEDIHARLLTGLDGTPMPSSADLISGGVATEEDLWYLAAYVRSLSPEKAPRPAEVVRAALRPEGLPAGPDDDAWSELPRYWVPLVGQVIQEPRWFAPTINGVWVQAAHDDREVVLRLTWHDPSESPSPEWADWRRRIAQFMEPKEEPAPAEGPLPDALTVQFPAALPEGRDLPFFLGGDARRQVYLWRWRSDAGVDEAAGRGFGNEEALPADAGAVTGEAVFEDGEWRLVLRRPIAAGEGRLELEAGTAIPMALFAWDGDNAETGKRASVSSWYYLWLDQPVAAGTYTVPLIAMVITALLGLLLVSQAQKAAERQARIHPDTQTIPEGV